MKEILGSVGCWDYSQVLYDELWVFLLRELFNIVRLYGFPDISMVFFKIHDLSSIYSEVCYDKNKTFKIQKLSKNFLKSLFSNYNKISRNCPLIT